MSRPRRVLMVAPYFPPRARVGAARPYKLALDLPAHGWTPSVVHLAGPAGDVPGLDHVPRYAIGAPVDRTQRAGGSSLAPRATTRSPLDRLDDLVPVDGWLAPMLAAVPGVLRFARAQNPDVVWSTADPWSSHVLASIVARRVRRPWVADFRDPWTLCSVRGRRRPRVVRAIDRRVERRVVGRADRIVFTADRTLADYARVYPDRADRMRVVTNGFRASVTSFSAQPIPGPQPLVLRFFGRFRPLSSAERIVRVLAELKQLSPESLAAVEVRSVGGLDATDRARAESAGVVSAFVAEEAVEPDGATERLSSSDLLLLSAEPGRDQIIPAKLFDYLAAGRPILGLVDSPEVASILARTATGVAFGSDADALAAGYLARAARARAAGASFPDVGPARPEAIDDWSSARVARRMAAVLDETLVRRDDGGEAEGREGAIDPRR